MSLRVNFLFNTFALPKPKDHARAVYRSPKVYFWFRGFLEQSSNANDARDDAATAADDAATKSRWRQKCSRQNKKRPAEVFVVANQRLNSLIVHAQPDKMAIVASFIRRIDVPNENAETFQSMQGRMQIYRLASISPKQLVASLLAMDALEPTTTLEVDESNNSIIAHASIADQFTIQKVIERLDGSLESFR